MQISPTTTASTELPPMPVPDSFIKNVALEIRQSYQLDNISSDDTNKGLRDIPLIGRNHHYKKFLEFLNNKSKKGVFLVTGYRGMGKTSFVGKVLYDYVDKANKCIVLEKIKAMYLEKDAIIQVKITLAQNNPKEIDILRLMTISAHDKFKMFLAEQTLVTRSTIKNEIRIYKRNFIWIFLALLICIIVFWQQKNLPPFLENSAFHFWNVKDGFSLIKIITIALFTSAVGFLIVWTLKFNKLKSKEYRYKIDESCENRISSLVARCEALVSHEVGFDEELKIEGLSAKLFGGTEKNIKNYPLADTKVIEYELQQFLREAWDKYQLQFIYIFDELDKVDPAISATYYYDNLDNFEKSPSEDSYQRDLRDRKQAIINIISGLKNFLTTAHARFIFIAGREMFDASLADAADRQSSLNSIFTYIFNIESLLKENDSNVLHSKKTEIPTPGANDNNSEKPFSPHNYDSLTTAIEEYLKFMLFDKPSEKSLFENAKAEYLIGFDRAYFILQNFVTFLAYRSNGSPKKLINIIQEFILVKADTFDEEKTIVIRCSGSGRRNKYLYFNYNNQYRIGFLNYLYRPYLIQNGRSSKLFSDNIIVSTPYLFDHLLKFHPFAFSITNLELIPEVLSTNRTPSLRKHIQQIIDYLQANHLRKTEIGLFDYKFYSRTLNEIMFLSKIFEQESAAFNFTLDEGYLVKLHIRSKIKELRSIYSRFLGDSSTATHQIFSLAHLNGILGDLHFFDQEYDDAIIAYSDANRPINQLDVATMNMRDFITLIRNKLKLGLCFEKISSYEEALAFYSDASQDAKRFMTYRLREAKDVTTTRIFSTFPSVVQTIDPKSELYHTSSINDLLQIINQSFIAKIILQEKMGVEGISARKLTIALGSFLTIVESIAKHSSRNHLISANLFLLTGRILYYKNSFNGFERQNINLNKLPEDVAANISKLVSKFNFNIGAKVSMRKPSQALYLYILGLAEVLQSREIEIDLIHKITLSSNIIKEPLKLLTGFISSNNEKCTGTHYKYIAQFLSSIGDCLFGIYYNPHTQYNQYSVGSIFKSSYLQNCFKESEDSQSPISFSRGLRDIKERRFTISDILRCYDLAAQFFLKQGRSVSSSFQYRKILHVLRMIVNDRDRELNALFLTFLEKSLITPTLQIISQNSAHTDIHMFNKAAKQYKIRELYAINNLSNHPETKEVILLYNYIHIKVGGPFIRNIKNLINSENSISSQYSRILELDFFSKYKYNTLSKIIDAGGDEWPKKGLLDVVDFIFSMLSVLRILKIYGTDYMLGYSFFAYTHLRVARFLKAIDHFKIEDSKLFLRDYLTHSIHYLLGAGTISSFSIDYHFLMAKDLYSKVIELHTAGNEFKKAVGQMIYLEDDFNDNAYHFGAALDRYMMTHNVFANRQTECQQEIDNLNTFDANKY